MRRLDMACSQFSKIATFFKPNCSVISSLRLSNFKDWNKRLNVVNATTWWHRRVIVFGVVMLDKILVATVYVRFDMFHQVIIAKAIQTFIIVPMAIACAFGINLYNLCAYCHFNLFNCIENE